MMSRWCLGVGLATLVGVLLGTQGCAGCEDRTPTSSSAEQGLPQTGRAALRHHVIPFQHHPVFPLHAADAQPPDAVDAGGSDSN